MSIVSYNGVTLPYPLHSSFLVENMYDDVGHVDHYLTKFEVAVQCVINANYLPAMVDVPAGTGLPAIFMTIQQKLSEPRKQLQIKVGPTSTSVIPEKLQGNVGTVDAYNGPQPPRCIITKLTEITFLLTWTCTGYYAINTEPGQLANKKTNHVLYNRWTDSQTINDCNFSTRRRNGKYFLRSDNPDGFTADDVRAQFAVTGVPPGFRRTGSEYTVSPDGCHLSYQHTDMEVFRQPPSPAFKGVGDYVESTTHLGAMRFGEVSLTLHGSKGTDQGELVQTALSVAATKLKIAGALQNAQGSFTVLDHSSIKVSFYDENVVGVRMRCQMGPNQRKKINGIATLDFAQITSVPKGSEPQVRPPLYTDRGSAALFLQAAAYWDKTLQQRLSRATGQTTPGVLIGKAGIQE